MLSLLHSASLPSHSPTAYSDLIHKTRSDKMNSLEVKRRILLSSPCFSLKFSPKAPQKLCVTTEEGEIFLFDTSDPVSTVDPELYEQFSLQLTHAINTNSTRNVPRDYRLLQPRTCWQGHYNAIFDSDFVWGEENQFLTASGDLTCTLWDLERKQAVKHLIGHKKSVRAVKSMPGNPFVIGSGGRDGWLFIYDLRENSGKAVLENRKAAEVMMRSANECLFTEGGFFMGQQDEFPEEGEDARKSKSKNKFNTRGNAVTCLCFLSERYVASGEANDDYLKIWDLRMLKQHCKDKLFDVDLQEFVPRRKVGEKCRAKKKSVKGKGDIGINVCDGFSYYTAEIMHYQKVREHYMFDGQYNGELKTHMTDNDLYEETSLFLPDAFSTTPQDESSYPSFLIGPHILRCALQRAIKDKTGVNVKGYSSLCMVPGKDQLLANSINNSLYLFNMHSLDLTPPVQFTGHKSSYYVKSCVSPCGQFVASGSQKGCICLWDIHCNKHNEPIEYPFHFGEVNCVDWSNAETNFIASSSDDGTVLILG